MDDRTTQASPPEMPFQRRIDDADQPTHQRLLEDPRALTILTTEHWSLLTARSLVYNETFARGGMFLTFAGTTRRNIR